MSAETEIVVGLTMPSIEQQSSCYKDKALRLSLRDRVLLKQIEDSWLDQANMGLDDKTSLHIGDVFTFNCQFGELNYTYSKSSGGFLLLDFDIYHPNDGGTNIVARVVEDYSSTLAHYAVAASVVFILLINSAFTSDHSYGIEKVMAKIIGTQSSDNTQSSKNQERSVTKDLKIIFKAPRQDRNNDDAHHLVQASISSRKLTPIINESELANHSGEQAESDKVYSVVDAGYMPAYLTQSRNKFSIQLASSNDLKYIAKLSKNIELIEPKFTYPFLTKNGSYPLYGLALGVFDDYKAAWDAAEKIEPTTKKFGVWIRPVGEILDDTDRYDRLVRALQYLGLSLSDITSEFPTWGMEGDVPVVIDNNADGNKEIIVWRSQDKAWYASQEMAKCGDVECDMHFAWNMPNNNVQTDSERGVQYFPFKGIPTAE